MVTPFERAVGALKRLGLWDNGKPKCPCCPSDKRRGFSLLPTTGTDGKDLALPTCFRGCDRTEIAAALGLEDHEIGWQTSFSHAGAKFSGVTIEGLKALPHGSARTFGIAASLGSMWTGRGRDGFASAPIGAITARVIRTPKQRRAILREANITLRALEYQVPRWIECRMACRCSDDVLALFRRPALRCPVCGATTPENPENIEDPANAPSSAPKVTSKSLEAVDPEQPHHLSTSKTVRGEEIRGISSTKNSHRKGRRNSVVGAKKFSSWEDRVPGKSPNRSDYPGWGELYPED